jgi:hypothetical protein
MDAALTGALRPSLLQKTKQTRNGGKNMEGMTHSKRKITGQNVKLLDHH